MLDHGEDVSAHLAARAGIHVRNLVWISARLRSTGAIDPSGFWNGIDAREFTIGGKKRVYQGAGTLLGVAPIIGGIGISVRMQRVSLSQVPPSIVNLISLYDVRFAPIEVHRVYFDPQKGVQIGVPARVLKGTVDSMPLPTPAEGGSATIELTVASAARALTGTLTVKKSNAAQRLIDPNDRGREYASISGAVGVFWGVKQARGAPPPTTAAPPPGPSGGGPDK